MSTIGREKYEALCQQNKYSLHPLCLPSGSTVIIILHVREVTSYATDIVNVLNIGSSDESILNMMVLLRTLTVILAMY